MKITIRNKNNEIDVKNIVKDSWFSSSGITLTKTNNIYKADYTNNTQRYGSISQEIIGTHAIIGHKYFLYFRVKSSVALNMVYVTFNDAGMSGIRVGTEWTDVIYKMTCSYTSGSYFRIYPNTSTNIYTGIFEFQDDVIYIDLTESGDENLTEQQIYNKYKNHFDELKNGGTYNPGSFEVIDGAVITENYNETLDSASVIIESTTKDIDIEPLDEVILEISETEKRYLCVDTYSKSQVSFYNPIYYTYNISLISQTKIAEGIILPNLKITSGTGKSIAEYIGQYNNMYGPKRRIGTTSSYSYQKRWTVSNKVYQLTEDIECPEMQWNSPTFREVLNDLLMIVDCVLVIRNNVIDCIELSKVGNNIDISNLSQVQTSRSLSDYASELRVNLVNVMQTSIPNTNDVCIACENMGFRNEDTYNITTNQFELNTRFPILELKELKMTIYLKKDDTSSYYFKDVDLTPYVYEYGEWRVKSIYYDRNNRYRTPAHTIGQYQQNSLYFVRGSNKINNFDGKYVSGLQTAYTFNMIMDDIYRILIEDMALDTNVIQIDTLKTAQFSIKYTTTASMMFQASKTDYPSNERVVIDNQTNSYVDAYKQGIIEYMKANRLGNENLIIQARYNSTDSLPKIGQTYRNDYIIYRTDYSIYKGYIVGNFYATKDYVLKDYFTGVKSKIRSWKILDGSEALERNDLVKLYCELGFENLNECNLDVSSSVLGNYFLNQFTETSPNPLTRVALKTYDGTTSLVGNNCDYYLMDLTSRIVGDSIVFTFGFSDNFYVSKYVSTDSDLVTSLGGLPELPYKYTNNDGTISKMSFSIFNTFIPYKTLPTQTTVYYEELENLRNNMFELQAVRPGCYNDEIGGNSFLFNINPLKKDNGEIIRTTLQFEFCSGKDVIIGSEFIKRMQAIRTNSINLNVKCYTSNEKRIYRNRDKLPSDARLITLERFIISNNRIIIDYSNSLNYLYITDNNDKVLFAFKDIDGYNATLYMNILKSLNYNIYDNNGKIIGTIEN